jgi:glycosyltransferase involved in cell wall biosynthesis
MKICFFGTYNPQYSRNRVIKRGLEENSMIVVECNEWSFGIKKYYKLWKKFKLVKNEVDFLFVGFPGYGAAILAKIFTGKKIIFDAFASIYDSMILDRKTAGIFSFKSFYYFLLDFLSCQMSDWVLVDTLAQKDFFVKTFKIKPQKVLVVYVGADIPKEFFAQTEKIKNNLITVFFYGTFIPLHGVDVILKSIALLENDSSVSGLRFEIIGEGQTLSNMKELAQKLSLQNVEFLPACSYVELLNHLNSADVSLGIFGATSKSQRVIPNKVFDALALGKPCITQDSPAIREILKNGENCILTKPHDEIDLSRKIKLLVSDARLRDKIGKDGQKLFLEKFAPSKVVAPILDILK